MDTLKNSLKRLRINPVTWWDLAQNKPVWRNSLKTGAAIHETNPIATAKAKIEARMSQAPQSDIIIQTHPTCPRCQRTQIGLIRNLRTQCPNRPTTATAAFTIAPAPTSAPIVMAPTHHRCSESSCFTAVDHHHFHHLCHNHRGDNEHNPPLPPLPPTETLLTSRQPPPSPSQPPPPAR
ncbi:hypothetical protein SprV_0702314400 [Sparganum proliferum]